MVVCIPIPAAHLNKPFGVFCGLCEMLLAVGNSSIQAQAGFLTIVGHLMSQKVCHSFINRFNHIKITVSILGVS